MYNSHLPRINAANDITEPSVVIHRIARSCSRLAMYNKVPLSEAVEAITKRKNDV